MQIEIHPITKIISAAVFLSAITITGLAPVDAGQTTCQQPVFDNCITDCVFDEFRCVEDYEDQCEGEYDLCTDFADQQYQKCLAGPTNPSTCLNQYDAAVAACEDDRNECYAEAHPVCDQLYDICVLQCENRWCN